MKLGFAVLVVFILSTQAVAKEIFAARCVPTLTKSEFVWRVEESRRGIQVRYSDPKKKFSAELRGAAADALRAKIAHLQFSRTDVELLRVREIITADGQILLRPFDGVVYSFTMPGREVISIDNPSFDLEHHPSLPETARLREALDFLEQLTRIAKKEKGANQSPEPTAGLRLPAAHL
jgi:hypothetical protein